MSKVLKFPEPTTGRVDLGGNATQPLVFAVWRCEGGCDSLVTSPNALCLHCAARESA